VNAAAIINSLASTVCYACRAFYLLLTRMQLSHVSRCQIVFWIFFATFIAFLTKTGNVHDLSKLFLPNRPFTMKILLIGMVLALLVGSVSSAGTDCQPYAFYGVTACNSNNYDVRKTCILYTYVAHQSFLKTDLNSSDFYLKRTNATFPGI
jgi:hypothetical protein